MSVFTSIFTPCVFSYLIFTVFYLKNFHHLKFHHLWQEKRVKNKFSFPYVLYNFHLWENTKAQSITPQQDLYSWCPSTAQNKLFNHCPLRWGAFKPEKKNPSVNVEKMVYYGLEQVVLVLHKIPLKFFIKPVQLK